MRMHDATGKPLDARVMGDKRYRIVATGNHQIIKTFGRQSFAFGQTFHYNSKVIRVLIVLDRSNNGTERDVFFQSLFLPTAWKKIGRLQLILKSIMMDKKFLGFYYSYGYTSYFLIFLLFDLLLEKHVLIVQRQDDLYKLFIL